jgi:hypothetical protein
VHAGLLRHVTNKFSAHPQDRRAEVEDLAQEAEDARCDVEARLAGMTAALDERSASLAAAAAEVRHGLLYVSSAIML